MVETSGSRYIAYIRQFIHANHIKSYTVIIISLASAYMILYSSHRQNQNTLKIFQTQPASQPVSQPHTEIDPANDIAASLCSITVDL